MMKIACKHIPILNCAIFFALLLISVDVFAQEVEASGVSKAIIKDTDNTSDNKANDNKRKYQSIFFSDAEIDAIMAAKQSFKSGEKSAINEDDFLSKLDSIAKDKKDGVNSAPDIFVYPQFFLASIAYYSENNWVVWVNDQKMTAENPISASGISVARISKDSATIDWQPKRMDKVSNIMDDSEVSNVKVDTLNKKVTFTLKPNQTFSSYAMKVVEGRLMPISEELNSGKIIK